MTEFMVLLATLIPLEVTPRPPSSAPSALYPSSGPGRGAYFIGAFIAIGILLLAMTLLRLRPKREDDHAPDR